MYLPMRIGGVKTRLVIDTGAAITILSSRIYNKIPVSQRPLLERPGDLPRLEVADKGLLEVEGRATFAFKLEGEWFHWNMLVADIADDGLLGLDFLHANNYVLGAEVGLSLNGKRVHCAFQDSPLYAARVTLKSDITLPGNSQLIADGVADVSGLRSEFGVIGPIPGEALGNGIMVGNAVIDFRNPDTGLPVRLLNLSSEDISLRKGTRVAYLHEAEEIVCFDSDESEKCETKVPLQVNRVAGTKRKVQHLAEPIRDLYEKSSKGLDSEERGKLLALLLKHDSLFAKSPEDLGRTMVLKHSIDTGNATPVKQPPRRPPRAFMGEEEDIIKSQLASGVVRESTSPWASPMVYVRKKDGSTRPCVDYRRLNELTKKDAYPLPRIDDCLDCLGGASLFSTLDLQSGYWQIEVNEEDKPKTAFTCRSGLWEYNMMPFGLCGAPSTFERCMELVMRGLQWKTLLIYLDDLIIYSTNFGEHISRLDEVFNRLSKAGFKLKPSKCQLFQEEVEFLGHVVTKDGVKPDMQKVKAVTEWPVPRNITDVRSFLGLCSYYRRFIIKFSTRASPLNQLLEKERPFIWTPECQRAFDDLKSALTGEEVMAYPQDDGLYILDTDASNTGIGATLSQLQWCEITQKEEERPILYASKTFTKTQKQYCVTRRELLAIVTFVQQFRHYLLGRKFLVRTDHSALCWMMSFKEPQCQMARWLEILSQFDFKIEHRAGKKHGNADSLSRIPCEPQECNCYDGETVIADLPCEGCHQCARKHQEWSNFMELDDVVPLTVKPVKRLREAGRPGDQIPSGRRAASSERDGGEMGDNEVADRSDGRDSQVKSKGDEQGRCDVITGMGCRNDEGQVKETEPGWAPAEWGMMYSNDDLIRRQRDDPDVGRILNWWRVSGERPSRNCAAIESPATRNLWLYWSQLVLRRGILYRRAETDGGPRLQLVVPRVLRDEILQMAHGAITAGHLGTAKTESRLKQHFYWHRMKEDVREWIQKCASCGARKSPNHRPAKAPIGSYCAGAPMDRIFTDVLGPFPRSDNGNKLVLLVMDQFSKWVEAYPIPDQTAETVAHRIVYEFISRFGCPLDIHSDQGTNYESKLFQEVCRLLEINKTRSSPYHAQSNGGVERFNRTLLDMIAAYVNENHTDWDIHLPLLTAAYRSSTHATTKYTPNMLMMGREVNLPTQIMFGVPPSNEEPSSMPEYVTNLREKINYIHDFARLHLRSNMVTQQKDYDTRIVKNNYEVGDLVYYLDSTNKIGKSAKIKAENWKGPFVVSRTISDLLFEIKGPPRTRNKILHHNRLKPYLSNQVPEWVGVVKHQVRPPEKVCNKNQAETIAQSTQTDHQNIPECRSRNSEDRSKESGLAKTNSDQTPGRVSQRKRTIPDRFGDVVPTPIV